MAEWDALPKDILVIIAKHIELPEDFCKFYTVCKSWHSVTSILGKYQTWIPWVMLTDKAEINYPHITKNMDSSIMLLHEVQRNEQIEGMHKRQFYSLLASKTYDFELPEATRKKCLGAGYGLLFTLGYDLQINILNPFSRQQIGLPDMMSFESNYEYDERFSPQEVIRFFVRKVAMSSNPYNISSNRDCIIMAIYGEFRVLGFARPGDKVWTDITSDKCYADVICYHENFYAVSETGDVHVCDINEAVATPLASVPKHNYDNVYLVESSGDLLLVSRTRSGYCYDGEQDTSEDDFDDSEDDVDDSEEDTDESEEDTDESEDDHEQRERRLHYTVGFSIFKLEEWEGDSSDNYPYKLTKVNNLGNNALFIGTNTSVSVPSSSCIKANCIYFSDDDVIMNSSQPRGSGYDIGIYDVESGNISLHYASNFRSHLTPPIWIIS